MYQQEYEDFQIVLQELERSESSIKIKIFVEVVELLENEFYKSDQNIRNKELYKEYDESIDFLKFYFNSPKDEFIESLFRLIEPYERINMYWIIGDFFKYYFNDYILLSNNIETKDVSLSIVNNLYYLRFYYFRFILSYMNTYSFCRSFLPALFKYFKVVDIKMLDKHFFDACQFNGGLLMFNEKEYELMMLKIIFKASQYSTVDVELKDIKTIEYYMEANTHKKDYKEFVLSNLIIENIKKRHRIKQGKIYKNEKELTKEQFELIKEKLIGKLFVKDTSCKQIEALFRADFKFLNENKLNLNTEFKLGLFHYFIKVFEEQDLFKVYGIFSSLNKFEWLVYDSMVVTSKDINDKKTDFPRGLEIIDGLITELEKNKKFPYKGS